MELSFEIVDGVIVGFIIDGDWVHTSLLVVAQLLRV